jgi:hypothetical protein
VHSAIFHALAFESLVDPPNGQRSSFLQAARHETGQNLPETAARLFLSSEEG